MTEQEILALIKPVGKKLIGFDVFSVCDLSYSDKMDIKRHYDKIPELNPVYVPAIRHRNEVSVHAVKDTFPYELLKSKAPNQSDAEWDYQKQIYQQVTFPTWGRAENKTKIIGNKQNYSIHGWDPEQKEYFYKNYPDHTSLPDFFFEVVRKKKINMPNQVCLLRPEYIPYKETPDGYIIDQAISIPYIVDIVDEYRTALFKDGKYLFVICEETLIVNDLKLYQFDLYTDEFIYKIQPIRYVNNEIEYDIMPILQHGWGKLPAQKLKGEIQDAVKGNVLFNSIFSFALPELNDATRLNSNLSISEYNAAFPTRIRVVDKCNYRNPDNQSCVDGKIWTGGQHSTCPSCNGTGEDSSVGPGGEIRVKMYSSTVGGNITQLPMTPPMTYVAPPVDIFTHLDSRVKDKMRGAFGFMFETEQANKETATGKALEKEEFYSSLVQFSNELFGLMAFAIEGIGFFMFTKDKEKIGQEGSFKMPTINEPTSFNFRDASDLTKEIADARLNGMPEPFILELFEEYAATRFNSDEEVARFVSFMVFCDRLWNKDDMTVKMMIGQTCTAVEAIVHSSFTSFIEVCESENNKFWDPKTTDQIRKDQIFAKAQAIADAIKAKQDEDRAALSADLLTNNVNK